MKIIVVTAIFLLGISASSHAGPLDFLGHADSSIAWVLDSALDPEPIVGPLNPPYDIGDNTLTRIDLETGTVTASIPLGSSGPVLAFELSPDGDTAIAARIFDNALLIVSGLSSPETAVVRQYPLPMQPLSLAFSVDGRSAAIGYQGGPGEAHVALVDNLDASGVKIGAPVSLEISATVLTAVEAVDFSLDGSRLVTQTGLHDAAPPDPAFFMPRIALQSHAVGVDRLAIGPAYEVDRHAALPPSPPFAESPTGVALGDFALTCDGLTALVPVSGALNLGQPDARMLVVDGINTGHLVLRQTLTPADGVDVAPFQVALAADCDRALVTNAFAGTITEITGIRDGQYSLNSSPLLMPFPGEPAVSANAQHVVVQHPRPPLDAVPPANLTIYDGTSLAARFGPLFGPVRSWIEAKDRTLATWPAGLLDRVAAADMPSWMTRMYDRRISAAIGAAHHGNPRHAYRVLRATAWITHWLERSGYLAPVDADTISSYLRGALYVLAEEI